MLQKSNNARTRQLQNATNIFMLEQSAFDGVKCKISNDYSMFGFGLTECFTGYMQQGQQFALSNLGSLLGQAQAPSQQLFNVGSQFQQQDLFLHQLVLVHAQMEAFLVGQKHSLH